MKREIRSSSWKKDFLAKSIDERVDFANSLEQEVLKEIAIRK